MVSAMNAIADPDPTPLKTNTTKNRRQRRQEKRNTKNTGLLGEASSSPKDDNDDGGGDGGDDEDNYENFCDAPSYEYPDSPASDNRSTVSSLMHSPPLPTIRIIDAEAGSTDVEETAESSPRENSQEPSSTPNSATTTPPPPPPPLYKSRRFKGYLTIFLASIINYNAALLADNPLDLTAVPATKSQEIYARAVALISAIVTGVVVMIHLDRYSPLESTLWRSAFSPKSKCETFIIVLLLLWWSVAAIVQTTVRGIAGDGKEQFNLYYSTWVCCWTCLWVAERKLVDFGYPTFRSFVTGWPYRAPGWISIFITDFFTLWWYVDAFTNTKIHPDRIPEQLVPFYETIPRSQYQWLIFIAAFTLLPSAIFILVEILRGGGGEGDDSDGEVPLPTTAESVSIQKRLSPLAANSRATGTTTQIGSTFSTGTGTLKQPKQTSYQQQHQFRQPQKKSGEGIFEGFCLLCLSICWVIGVIVATTPGGFASQVGNAYFSTWATTVFVLETFLWFIHDWRQSVHKALGEKEWEYRQNQQRVLQATLQKVHAEQDRGGRGGGNDEDDDDDDDDDDSEEEDDDDDNSEENYEDAKDTPDQDDIDDYAAEDEEDNGIIMAPRRIHLPDDHEPGPSGASSCEFHGEEADYLPEDSDEDDDHRYRKQYNADEDDVVAKELRMKQANEKAYFDTLDDILK